MTQTLKTLFAPELHIPNGTTNIDFYLDFGAKEHFRLLNDKGSIHVVELSIDGAVFHLHETMRDALEPTSANGVTSVVGYLLTMFKTYLIGLSPQVPRSSIRLQITTTGIDKECSGIPLAIFGKFKSESNWMQIAHENQNKPINLLKRV